jgi:hypothetical protein
VSQGRAMRSVFYVVLVICAAANGLAQQKAGLLLTTTSASSDSQQPFHAYWITRDGAQVQVVEGMRLLVPRKTGWWEVGITELTRVNSPAESETLWAAPFGTRRPRKHVIPVSDDEACMDDMSTYSVSWVGTDFVALHHGYESSCGTHPISEEESFVANLDDLRNSEQERHARLRLSEVGGADAAKAMEFGAEVANSRATAERDTPVAATDNAWMVIRSKGRYRLLGTTPVEHGHGGDTYDIPLDPPKTLIGSNDLSIGWDAILDNQPDALDAYTSPNSDTVVVITPRYLMVFDVKEQQIGTRVSRIPIESSAVIAAQWAIWTEVDRWSDTVVPALREAPYQPVR